MLETWVGMRFPGLEVVSVLGREVPVAAGIRARLLGLAYLDRADAGAGLLIPRCSSVHSFGMRFDLDLYFLDANGSVLEIRRCFPPRRFAICGNASAVLEIPATEGGEFSPPRP